MSALTTTKATIFGSVRIIHTTGLHARPSLMFTRLAKTFTANIGVAQNPGGPWMNAKSIVKVMGLKAPFDTVLFIRADGTDAELAIQSLTQLIEGDFEGPTFPVGDENARLA